MKHSLTELLRYGHKLFLYVKRNWIYYVLSFLLFELMIHLIEHFIGIHIHEIPETGMFISFIIFSFKYHIFCCGIPALCVYFKNQMKSKIINQENKHG